MTAMIDWVEKSKAPDSMLATRVVDNQVVRSAPALSVSTGRALFRARQHRRCGQFSLCCALKRCWTVIF